ncbi:MAG: DUF2461 domain-containing protein [Bacteroidetes bacterium]|nr:DUF2461 domain-containing protein [Bacteroidota bacterium]
MEAIFKFLTKLDKNNSKEWFDSNRAHYQELKQEYIGIVDKVIQQSSAFDPMLKDVDASKAIFRINRDVRFSKNKAPYKTNFGASINPGGKKSMIAGYYIHLEPGKSFLAAGTYMPEPPYLSAIRQEIDYNLEEFKKIVNAKDFKKEFTSLSVEVSLKTVPKGYDKENPALEFLKLKHFIVVKDLTDKEVLSKDFIKNTTKSFKASLPLITFLRRIKD